MGPSPCSILRAKRVIFYSFIINTIKFRLRFWFFFFPLSEYTRTFIIKCSLSSILQRTRHKSQETMENVNKAERIVEFFLCFFFVFIFFEFLQFFCLFFVFLFVCFLSHSILQCRRHAILSKNY